MTYIFIFLGWMFDVTQNYNIPFYVGGGIGILSVLSVILVNITHKMELKKKKLSTNEKSTEPLDDSRIRTFTC